MRAAPGSHITIKSHHLGEPGRTGEVLAARGPDESEPFVVRWAENGHTSLLFPGDDCIVDGLVYEPLDDRSERPATDPAA